MKPKSQHNSNGISLLQLIMLKLQSYFPVTRPEDPFHRLLVCETLESRCLLAGVEAIGGETRVNNITTGFQMFPSVDVAVNGDFAITWTGAGGTSGGNANDVYVRKYSSSGTPLTSESRVNVSLNGNQEFSEIAMTAASGFVVVWQDSNQALSIFGRRYSPSGTPLGTEFLVRSLAGSPALDANSNGQFVVVWQVLQANGASQGIAFQLYGSNGSPIGGIGIATSNSNATLPSVAMANNGSFAISWRDYSTNSVFVRQFDATGLSISAARTVKVGGAFSADIATDGAGNFTICWLENSGLKFQQFDKNGSAKGTANDVANTNAGSTRPRIAMDEGGDFAIVWEEYLLDGSGLGVYAQRYAASGIPSNSIFRVNSFVKNNQKAPSIAMGLSDQYVVAWDSYDQANLGYANDVYFQRYIQAINAPPVRTLLVGNEIPITATIGTPIGTLSTLDPDPRDTHSYVLSPGQGDVDNSRFQISGNLIQIRNTTGMSVGRTYSVRIRTTDSGGLSREDIFSFVVVATTISLTNNTIPENRDPGTLVGTLSSTLPSLGGTLTYTMPLNIADNSKFTLDGTQLRTNATFDFEARKNYAILVRVTNSIGAIVERTIPLVIQNVDEQPSIQSPNVYVIPENQTYITDIRALDPEGAFLYYSLLGPDSNKLTIDANGRLQFRQPPDYELAGDQNKDNIFEFNLTVTDATTTAVEMGFSVTVVNLNEPPTITTVQSFSISEEKTYITTIEATDPESDLLRYQLLGSDSELFSISSSGILSFITAQDYEAPADTDQNNIYEVEISVNDGVNPPVTKLLRVTVTDQMRESIRTLYSSGIERFTNPDRVTFVSEGQIDPHYWIVDAPDSLLLGPAHVPFHDRYPFTTGEWGNDSVSQYISPFVDGRDAPVGEYIYETSFDLGEFDPNTVSIEIQSLGVDNRLSGIRVNSGPLMQITEGSTLANGFFRGMNRLTFVTFNDSSRNRNPTGLRIGIVGTGVQTSNAPPIVESGTFIVNEGEIFVGNIIAHDPDNDLLRFELGGDDAGSFSLSQTGQLQFSRKQDFEFPGDLDLNNEYVITILVADPYNPPVAITATVQVRDINEPPSLLNLSPNSLILNENTLVTSQFVISEIQLADDALQGTAGNLLSLRGTDADKFSIAKVGSEYRLFLLQGTTLDFELSSTYFVSVVVDDPAVGTAPDLSTAFVLSLLDVNEAPSDFFLSNNLIAENLPAGQSVGYLSARDQDSGNVHSYSLTEGIGDVDNNLFRIVDNELQTKDILDFEPKNIFSIRVRVTDSDGLSLEKVLDIHLMDQNEGPTSIVLSKTSLILPELTNTEGSTKLADIAIVDDALQGSTGNQVYLSGPDGANFFIVRNGANYELHLAAAVHLDFETQPTLIVSVNVDDEGVGSSPDAVSNFTLTLSNVNEAPFGLLLSENKVDENVQVGVTLGSLTTVDPDFDDPHTYSLVNRSGYFDNNAFLIFGDRLLVNLGFDFEAKKRYDLVIRTTDASGLFFDATFAIDIRDVNEPPTGIVLLQTIASLPDGTNTTSAIKVADISVTDDELKGQNVLGLSGNDAGSFLIVGNELFLRPGCELNYFLKPLLTINVTVDDASVGTQPDAIASLTLPLTDSNNPPTALTLTSNHFNENTAIGSTIARINVLDADLNDTHVFTLVPGEGDSDNGLFEIVDNRLIVIALPDYEKVSSHSVRIRATDPGGLFVDKSFTLNIDDLPEGTDSNDVFSIVVSPEQFFVYSGGLQIGVFPIFQSFGIYGFGGQDTLRIIGAKEADNLVLTSNGVITKGTLITLNSIEAVQIDLGDGNDSIFVEGHPFGLSDIVLSGGTGDDLYEFDADNFLGLIVLDEFLGGVDTLSFHETSTVVSANLSLSSNQVVNSNLLLKLRSGTAIENLIGSSNDDFLFGNAFANVISGGDGIDFMNGGNGDDTYEFDIDSPLGLDTIKDASGQDTLDFSASTSSGIAIDLSIITAQVVSPSLTLILPSFIENIIGTQLNDVITGNARANRLEGVGGDDMIAGGAGNDVYIFRADFPIGKDTLNDAVGVETLDFSSTFSNGVSVSLGLASSQFVNSNLSLILGSATNFDNIIGSCSDDSLTGNSLANRLIGGPGIDVLIGLSGNDIYAFDTAAQLGSDTIVDSAGIDTVDFSTTVAGSGVTFNLGLTSTQTVNSNLSLALASATSIENLTGSSLDDSLIGNSLPNMIIGGPGSDSLNAMAGNDTFNFDGDLALGTDTIDDPSGVELLMFALTTTKAVSIDLSKTTVQAVSNSLSVILTSATSIENVTGGALGNNLIGNSLSNTFIGGQGNDLFDGAEAGDIFMFDVDVMSGIDTVSDTGSGIDSLNFSGTTTVGISVDLSSTATQVIRPSYLSLILSSGSSIEKVIGTNLVDSILGNALNNILLGGAGNDTLRGGAGRDLIIGGLGLDTIDGGDDDDLLIAGTTNYDANGTALNQILSEWASTDTISTRSSKLRAGTGGLPTMIKVTTIKKDLAANSLTGGRGDDWYFADQVGGTDTISDLAENEIVDEL